MILIDFLDNCSQNFTHFVLLTNDSDKVVPRQKLLVFWFFPTENAAVVAWGIDDFWLQSWAEFI
jgi:hypothetical protein